MNIFYVYELETSIQLEQAYLRGDATCDIAPLKAKQGFCVTFATLTQQGKTKNSKRQIKRIVLTSGGCY